MFVCHCEVARALKLTRPGLVLIALAFALVLQPGPGLAHAPFDSNARVVVMEQSLEVSVTVGSGLTGELLKGSGANSFLNTGVGPGTILPVELAPRFFEIATAGNTIPASQLRVLSDGLESTFIIEYPRPAATAVQLKAEYAKHLPPAAFSALIVTDENNQMLGSHIVKLGSAVAKFNLPSAPIAVLATTASPSVSDSNPISPAVPLLTASVTPPQPRWRYLVLIFPALLIALAGWWLAQRIFHREQN